MSPNPWDTRYAADTFFYGTEPNDFLRAHAGSLETGSEVLCLAEGEGRNAVFLATQGLKVTGVDGSAVGLAKAQALAARAKVSIATVVADLADFDCGLERWDAVVSIWCHLPRPLRTSVHGRVAKALRPGGVLLLEHYHPRQLEYKTGGPPDAAWMVTLAELETDFAGFAIEHRFEGEREVHEGPGHGGRSYVTQFIARKG